MIPDPDTLASGMLSLDQTPGIQSDPDTLRVFGTGAQFSRPHPDTRNLIQTRETEGSADALRSVRDSGSADPDTLRVFGELRSCIRDQVLNSLQTLGASSGSSFR